MYNLTKKQKILVGTLILIIFSFICYYIYAKDENNIQTQENEVKEENTVKNNETETYSDTRIFIHISGAIQKEGVVELKVNSRISDAIEKAGGLKEDADLEKINLAYILEDGVKIYIPSLNDKTDEKSEETNEQKNKDETEKYITSSKQETENKEENKQQKQIKVNINTATQAELETLPGIGPSTALKIIEYRKENGKFNNIEDIKNVSGIGESKYNSMKDLIKV